MNFSARSRPRSISWIGKLGRTLALLAQIVVLVAPIAEARETRELAAHVEAPRTVPHPGHHPESCPACVLQSVFGQPIARQQFDSPVSHVASSVPFAAERSLAAWSSRSNSTRAPPVTL